MFRNPYTLRPYDTATVSAAVAGRVDRLTPADRTEVVRRLTARGVRADVIAARLGCTVRTVNRAKARVAA